MPPPMMPNVCSVTPASRRSRVPVAGRESECDEVDRRGPEPRAEMPGRMVARGTSPAGALRPGQGRPGRPERRSCGQGYGRGERVRADHDPAGVVSPQPETSVDPDLAWSSGETP